MKLTRGLAAKVLETVDAGLCQGIGEPIPGQMCVEAAVCYAMGLPHGDQPTCVSPAVRSLKIRLNDAAWSDNEARAKGLRRLAIAQLGTETLYDVEFAIRVSLLIGFKLEAYVTWAHKWLSREDRSKEAARAVALTMEDIAVTSGTNARMIAQATSRAARAAAAEEVWAATGWVDAAVRAAAMVTESKHSWNRNKALSDFAEQVVQILIEMKAPGTKYLDLTV